jgi:hypothetical protein
MKFVATNKGKTTNFSPPFLVVVGSVIRNEYKSGSGIWDKHPGSGKLLS